MIKRKEYLNNVLWVILCVSFYFIFKNWLKLSDFKIWIIVFILILPFKLWRRFMAVQRSTQGLKGAQISILSSTPVACPKCNALLEGLSYKAQPFLAKVWYMRCPNCNQSLYFKDKEFELEPWWRIILYVVLIVLAVCLGGIYRGPSLGLYYTLLFLSVVFLGSLAWVVLFPKEDVQISLVDNSADLNELSQKEIRRTLFRRWFYALVAVGLILLNYSFGEIF